MCSNNKQRENQNLYVSESTSPRSILTAWNFPFWTVVTSVWGAKCSRLQIRLRIVPVPCCRAGVCSRWVQLLPGTNTASDQFLGAYPSTSTAHLKMFARYGIGLVSNCCRARARLQAQSMSVSVGNSALLEL